MTPDPVLATRTTFDLVRQLELSGAITPTGIDVPADLSFERFEALLRFAASVKRWSSWAIGDLLNFGEGAYGERYAQAMEVTGLSHHTLENYAYVCRQIRRDRRREGVPFSVHAEVASLEAPEQKEWLELAEMEGWSVAQLRAAMKEKGATQKQRQQPLWSKGVDTERAVTLARRVLVEAAPNGDGTYIVSGELIVQLRAALGEEE